MSDTDNNVVPTTRKHLFQKGNPGRRPGRIRTQFLAAIGKANADAIVKKTVELALLGKQWACEAVLARLYPRRRVEPLRFRWPCASAPMLSIWTNS
jgi:hypothetical protein